MSFRKGTNTTHEEMWKVCCAEAGIDRETAYQAWSFGEKSDELAALVAAGRKSATSSAYDLYALDPDEPMPQAGDYSVILDSADRAVCVIRDSDVRTIPFCKVGEEHARREGEGDGSLSYWQEVHRRFFTEELRGYGLEFHEDRRIVCETFEVIYPPKQENKKA